MKYIPLIILTVALTACDSLPDWMGGDSNKKPPLPGTRIAVLADATDIKPDDLAGAHLNLPESDLFNASPKRQQSAKIGDGNQWYKKFFTAPVLAGQTLFVMDAKGFISAHHTDDVAKVFWTSRAAVEKDEQDVLGGGLAFDGGTVFATNGYGRVVALSAETGKEIWHQNVGAPVRVAPKAASGKVIVLSVDNQTFALSAEKGDILWTHRGISEAAEYVSDTSPSISGSTVVVPHTTGELVALDIDSGKELWSDSLATEKRTNASAILSGIGGSPVIDSEVVYAASSNGVLAATSLASGHRIWERDLPSHQSPAVSGDYLFVFTTNNTLVGLSKSDGKIIWVQQFAQYADAEAKVKKKPIQWYGPVVAGGRVWLVNVHGEMVGVNPKEGKIETHLEVPDGIAETPVIAGGVMYLVTQDAMVYSYK